MRRRAGAGRPILVVGFLCVLAACHARPEAQLTDKELSPAPQGGQLPEAVVRDASTRYGGSMPAPPSSGSALGAKIAGLAPAGPAGAEPASMVAVGLTLTVGAMDASRLTTSGRAPAEIGEQVRGVVARGIGSSGITLVDAPGLPAPGDGSHAELARRGVRLVVVGLVSRSDSGSETTVFLRAVETRTGQISAIASGRAGSPDAAAAQATDRLVEKLRGLRP